LSDSISPARRKRLLYICDWLPPDFGAVGQYGLLFAREAARAGADVVLAGLSSRGTSETVEPAGPGSLKIVALNAAPCRKDDLARRMAWTVKTNTRLVSSLFHEMRRADEIVFTGSPPLFLHWIAPLNLLLGKRLTYRITDFHPECLIASRGRASLLLRLLYRLTLFWRRRVDAFEALGEDQRRRLQDIGIPLSRITLKRDISPVRIDAKMEALTRPAAYNGKVLLLYSGNWGVAHDYLTFVRGYLRHHQRGSGRVVLWLNALGSHAAAVADQLAAFELPLIKTAPVPLDELARLLVSPDAHLITLSDPFVGFVLPSKVYGCLESRKPILFIGSAKSDVHLLCGRTRARSYWRVDAGDALGFAETLEDLADHVEAKEQARKFAAGVT